MLETNDNPNLQGRLFYDGTCRFCLASIRRLAPVLRRCRVEAVPFAHGATEPEMRLRWRDGREWGGAEAFLFLAGCLWWTRPLHWLGRIPGIVPLTRWLYRRIASRRHCFNGACRLT